MTFVIFWSGKKLAAFYFVARDVLGGLTETWLLWYGLIFMAMVMLRPEGLAGMRQSVGRRNPERRSSHLPRSATPATEAV